MQLFKHRLFLPTLSGIITSFIAFGLIFNWLGSPVSAERFEMRIPGMDNIPPGARDIAIDVTIGEFFESYSSDYQALPGSWPNFRGADYTNISREDIPLLNEFPPDGPPVLWRKDLGEGHAAFAIHHGRIFILDYVEQKRADAIRCISLLDGKELWRRWYELDIRRNHGYSRTIPAVSDDHVVSIGPMGHVMCLDTDSGELLWTMDMASDFEAEIPQWYTGQCPLLDKNKVILAPGGKNTLLIGVDATSGEIIWETPNPGGWKQSHSSVVPMNYMGNSIYVYSALGGIVGVAAHGENAGEILWKVDWDATVIAPSPVIIDDEYIFQSAGYGAGSVFIRITGTYPRLNARVVGRHGPRDALATEQQSAIQVGDHLFGVMTKDAGTRRMMLVACNSLDPSDFVFPGKTEFRYGLGPIIMADDKLFALTDNGVLSLLTFENDEFIEHGRHDILPGVDAWGPIAIADGIMLLRDSTSMVALDMTIDSRWADGENYD